MSVEPDTEPLFNAEPGKRSTDFHESYVQPDQEAPASTSTSNAGVSGNLDGGGPRGVGGGGVNAGSNGTNAKQGVFTFDYYAHFFDVDTRDVLERCTMALNPFTHRPFLVGDDEEAGVRGRVAGGRTERPDLYGPFWICTTVVLVLFFASTLVGLLFSSWQGVKYEYKFELLTGAAGLMYSYTFVLPVALWVVLRYLNICPTTTLLQLVSLYGYSNVPWIPVAILSVSPLLGAPNVSNVIRWVFIALGYALSGAFIGKNIYIRLLPEHNSSAHGKKQALVLLAIVTVLHTALAFAVKLSFFGGVKVEDKKN